MPSTGEVLDAGCGTGENALFLASRGLSVLGVDWSGRAIEMARAKAAERDSTADFVTGDATDLAVLDRTFDTVIDSGLFHTFDDTERPCYVRALGDVVRPGGVVHLLCFSDREPWGGGPRRVSQAEIREAFVDGWIVESIEAVRFEARMPGGHGAEAWHATIRRTKPGATD